MYAPHNNQWIVIDFILYSTLNENRCDEAIAHIKNLLISNSKSLYILFLSLVTVKTIGLYFAKFHENDWS